MSDQQETFEWLAARSRRLTRLENAINEMFEHSQKRVTVLAGHGEWIVKEEYVRKVEYEMANAEDSGQSK